MNYHEYIEKRKDDKNMLDFSLECWDVDSTETKNNKMLVNEVEHKIELCRNAAHAKTDEMEASIPPSDDHDDDEPSAFEQKIWCEINDVLDLALLNIAQLRETIGNVRMVKLKHRWWEFPKSESLPSTERKEPVHPQGM